MNTKLTNYMILATVILMDILGGAEVDLFVPSFPELQSKFGISPFWVAALLSGNFIGSCLGLFCVGILSDLYGRKPIILLGTMIFIIGSMICLYAISYKFLLVGRFLQGIGVAAPSSLCFLIIADSYTIEKQQYLFGILNGIINASVAAAPVVGCYITMYFHWQGNFIALLFLGLIVLVMTIVFIPNQKLHEHKKTISLTEYTAIFRSKNLMLSIVSIVFMCSAPWWIFIGISSILYMKDLGVSLSQFGYYQGLWAFVFAFGSIFSGLIINQYNQKKLLYISGLICILGLISVSIITWLDITNPLLITLAFLPCSIGTIIPYIIIYPLCLSYIPQMKGGISAIMQATRLIVSALGLELAGYHYQGSFQNIGIIILSVYFTGMIAYFLIVKNFRPMQSLDSINLQT